MDRTSVTFDETYINLPGLVLILILLIFRLSFGPGGPGGLCRSTGLDLGFNLVVLTPPETSRVSRYGNFTETV